MLWLTHRVLYSMSGRRQDANTLIDTRETEEGDELLEHMEWGSLEVKEPLLDISEGTGDWVQDPEDAKLASKLTSEPELWEHSKEERLFDIGEPVGKPDREWQCFNIFFVSWNHLIFRCISTYVCTLRTTTLNWRTVGYRAPIRCVGGSDRAGGRRGDLRGELTGDSNARTEQ